MRNASRRKTALLRFTVIGGLLLAASAVGLTALTGSNSEVAEPEAVANLGTVERQVAQRTGNDEAEARRAAREKAATKIKWRDSIEVGTHSAGSLRRGVRLPADGPGWSSWDPILKRAPNRAWRRWGSDRMVRTVLGTLREYIQNHPASPRILVGDLSRPRGGDFGPQFGFIGHASHQNGLDVDVYYPRKDRRLQPPDLPDEVDLKLAQSLVDVFVAAGAEQVFVGPSLGLEGPADIVVPLANHDNHLHARLPLLS